MKMTDEERAMLTDEELAGQEEGEDFDEGQGKDDATTDDTTTDPAGTDDKAKPGEEAIIVNDDDAGDDATKAKTKEGDVAAEDGAKADDKPAEEVDETPQQPVRSYAALPEDYDDQVAKIATDKEALVAKFDEGDITMAEYHKELDTLNRHERELERVKDRVEYDTRARYDHWVNVDVANFMTAHPQYRENPMLAGLLDQEVRKLQAASDNDTDPTLLTKAHKTIAASLPAIFDAPKAEDKPTAKPAERKTVPTLANVPAADIDQPGATKFDALDRLYETDPVAAETAFDKLSPAEQNEYLAS